MIPGTAVFLLALPVMVALLVRGQYLRHGPWRLGVELATVAYAAAVVAITLFPLPVTAEAIAYGRANAGRDLAPFETLALQLGPDATPRDRLELVGNTVLLLPMGVAAPTLVPALRRIGPFVLLALAAPIGIELTQLAISTVLGYSYRFTEIDDVILNATGAMAGYGIWRLGASAVAGRRH